MNPLISVIVPVYNVEAFLRPCADSLLNQSYKNLEILLVDDGSTDGSPSICDEYAAKDPRVRVIHKENGGLSSARNAGMDAANGVYIAFLDSDDGISPRFIELLLAADADVAQCGFSRFSTLDTQARFRSCSPRDMALQMHADASGACTVVWNKLYRRSVLEGLRFPEGKQHEDEFFTWRALWQANSCAVTDAALYYYRPRAGSIMAGGFSERSLDAVDALRQRADFYRAQGDMPLAILAEAAHCHRLRALMPGIRKELPAQYPARRKALRQSYRAVLRSPFAGKKKKLSLSLQMLSPRLYQRMKGSRNQAL